LVTVLEFARCGEGWVILKAKRDALLELPKMMWRKRQEIQQKKLHRLVKSGPCWASHDS